MIQFKCSVASGKISFQHSIAASKKHNNIINDISLAIQDILNCNKDLDGPFEFVICQHDSSDLVDDPSKSHHYMFGQEYFEGRVIDKDEFLPIIHFFREDIANEKNDYKKSIKYRYANVVESSIWNFRVLYKKYDRSGRVFEAGLLTALRFIQDNTSRKVYELSVTREYAELNARMTRQAYLEEPITKSGASPGGHAQYVSPFTFHSEREISNLINDEFNNDNDKYKDGELQTKDAIESHRWRILLVDDKSMLPMKNAMGNSYTGLSGIWDTKAKVIKGVIESYFKREFKIEIANVGSYHGNDANVLIETVSNKSETILSLKEKKYDIILLDYLLENGTNIPEYGHDILNDIADNRSLRDALKIGPRGKLFFLFISAYSSAIRERLLADGLNSNENYWQISVGACPINTPQMFLYNLIKQMERRLDDSGILKLSSDSIYKVINKIYANSSGVRKRANTYYQEVLSLQYHYRNILKDVEIPFGQNASVFDTKGSVLMTDFIQNKINLGGMLEHLTQLVHITAFGTVRQWPEMWEEYIYFKAMFEKQIEKDKENVDCGTLFSNIENYILKLKSQQQ